MATLKVDTITSADTPTVSITDGASISGVTTFSNGTNITSGNLLLGQNTSYDVYSSSKLQISATDGTAALSVSRWSDNGSSPYINIGKSRGAFGTPTVVQSGDRLGQINFVGADGTDLASHGASIAAYVDGTPGSNDMPGRIVFATASDGGAAETERLRIDSSGISKFKNATGGQIWLGGASAHNAKITITDNNGTGNGSLTISGPSGDHLRINSAGQIQKRQDPVNRTSLKTYSGEGLWFDHYQLQSSGTYRRYADIVSVGDGSWGSILRFHTMPDSGSPTERLRIDQHGRVGINKFTHADTASALTIQNGVSSSDHTILDIVCNDNETSRIYFSEDSNSGKGSIRYTYTSDSNHMGFYTNGTASSNERLRIHSDGRVMPSVSSNRGGVGMVGAFRARVTSVYDFPSGTRKIILGTEEFDANGWFDHTTNYRYTPLCKGWYQLHFHLQFKTGINNNAIELQLYPYFNGAATPGPVQGWDNNHGNYAYNSWSTIMYFNGTTDYVEFYGNCSHTTDVSTATHMMGYLVHPVA